jgi:Reverse transcriptase (RNA-dependent DNA polymerase)
MGSSPAKKFSNSNINVNMRHFHTFGCPIYVLDTHMAGPIKGPKWNSRARMAIYIGNSENHASSVGLALSMQTGLVSPVFHAKYDDQFSTVRDPYGKYIPRAQWQLKCGFSKGNVREAWIKTKSEGEHINKEVPDHEKVLSDVHQDISIDNVNNVDDVYEVANLNTANQETTNETSTGNPSNIGEVNTDRFARITRLGRQTKLPTKYDDYVVYESVISPDNVEPVLEYEDPITCMATGGQDNFYYHEILHEPDKLQFINAMKQEIKEHNDNGNWVPVRRCDLPADTKVIPLVWAMRQKRSLTDGTIHKWKARLNVDGSKQIKGVNFWETYAPVAQWISICLILCMVSLNKWQIKTFDFVQAFP